MHVASSPRITSVRFTPVSASRGMLGFASFVLDDELLVDGVAVRCALDGRLLLSWPGRIDRRGRERHHIRPLDARAQRHLDERLLYELRPLIDGRDR